MESQNIKKCSLIWFVALMMVVSAFFLKEGRIKKPLPEPGLKISELGSALSNLEELDVILRQGIDYDSKIISKLSGSPFSHVGVVINTSPIEIVHASSEDTNYQVAISSLAYFLQHAQGIAIKRYALDGAQKKRIAQHLKAKIGQSFTFQTEQPLYCTTLVEEAFGKDFLQLSYQQIDFPLVGGRYLMPQAFYADTKSKLILEYFPRPPQK